MCTPIRRGPRFEENTQPSWGAAPAEIMWLILGQRDLTAIDLINFAATEPRAAELVEDQQLWLRHGLRPPMPEGPVAAWTQRFQTLPPAVQEYMVATNADVNIFSGDVDPLVAYFAVVEQARVAGAEGALNGDGNMQMHVHLGRAAALANDYGIVAPTLSDDELRAAYQRGMERARDAAAVAVGDVSGRTAPAAEDASVERVVAKVERLLSIAELYAERGGVPFVSLPAQQLQPMYRRALQRCRVAIAEHLATGACDNALQKIRDANNYAAKAGEPRVTLDAKTARDCFRIALRRPRVATRARLPSLRSQSLGPARSPADAPLDSEEVITEASNIAMDNALYNAEFEARIGDMAMMQVALHKAAFFALAAGKNLPETAPDWYQRAYANLAANYRVAAAEDRENARFTISAPLYERHCLQVAAECAAAAGDPQSRWERNRLSINA